MQQNELPNIIDLTAGRKLPEPRTSNPTPFMVAYYTDEDFLDPITSAKFRHLSCAHVYAQSLRQTGMPTRIVIALKPLR